MDIRTIFIFSTFILGIMALSVFFASLKVKTHSGFGYWTGFFALLALAQVLMGLYGKLPDLLSVVLGNLTALVALGFYIEGTFRFYRLPGKTPNRLLFPLLIVAMCGVSYFTFVQPNFNSRIVISMTSTATALMVISWHLFKGGRAWGSLPERVNLLTLLLFGVFCFIRAINAALNPAASILAEGPMLVAFIFTLSGFAILNMISCIFLNLQRTNEELSEARGSLARLIANLPGVVYRVQLFGDELIEVADGGGSIEMGFELTDFLNKPIGLFNAMIEPDDLERDAAAVRKAIAEGLMYELTFSITDKDGRRKVLLDKGVGVYETDGMPRYREGILIDITSRVEAEEERTRLVAELTTALEEVKELTGLIPICAGCKKIRDDSGYWNQLEAYFAERTGARFSHGLCPDCALEYYPEAKEQIERLCEVKPPR